MKLKIIQISPVSPSFFLDSGKGSIEYILKDNWNAQVAFQLKKFYPYLEIECWSPEKEYKEEKKIKEKGVKFRVFSSSFFIRHSMEISFPMLNALKLEIRKAEKENKKLILHFHEYHAWQVYLMLLFLKKTKNIKIIAQHHGGRSPMKNLEKYKRLILVFPIIALMQFLENLLLKKIDIFYALSDEEMGYLKMLTPKSKIKFQTMGISDEYFKKIDKKTARRKLKLDLNKRYLIYIGRIKTTKGVKELLDAIKKLEDKNIELLLIGNGPDFNKYKSHVEKNWIKNVKFFGPVYDLNKKLLYYSACDYLILSSYTEGAPVVLMEAIAKNLPVIATDVGGIPIMIKNGKEGIIIKPKSANEIVKAINQILSWKKKDIKKYAEKYKWKGIISKTITDYMGEVVYHFL